MNGSFLMHSCVVFWYVLISIKALVPGLYLLFFLGAPSCGPGAFLAFVETLPLFLLPLPVTFFVVLELPLSLLVLAHWRFLFLSLSLILGILTTKWRMFGETML